MRQFRSAFLFILALAAGHAHAQVAVFTKDPGQPQKDNLDPEVLDAFRATTTVFFLCQGDDPEVWRKALTAAWTFNTLEVKPYTAMADYEESMKTPGGYSFFTLMQWPNYTEVSLWMPWPKKSWVGDQKLPIIRAALIKLDLDSAMTAHNQDKDLAAQIYHGGAVRNWRPHVMAKLLHVVSDGFAAGKSIRPSDNWFDAAVLKDVKKEKLFVLDEAVSTRRFWSDEKGKKVNYLKDYSGPYELITMDALDKKIASGEEFNYLILVRTFRQDYLMIQHSVTGKVLYSDADLVEYRDKLFDRLVKGKDRPGMLVR